MGESSRAWLDARDGHAIIRVLHRPAGGNVKSEWIGTKEAAEIIGVSESTIYRSFAEGAEPPPDQVYGRGNWRQKPLMRRRIMQIRRSRAIEMSIEAH
jgi:predicted DNA-binding transcriptional regulator AlpA